MRRLQQGFGFIDLLIGLLVGSLVIIAAYAALFGFRAMQHTGVDANSAMENGSLALHSLEHDVKMGGLGLVANSLVTCSTLNAGFGGSMVANNALIAPVMITSGGNAPDSITVTYGTSMISGAPALLPATLVSTARTVALNSANGMTASDYALISGPSNATPCTLVQITSIVTGGGGTTVNYNDNGAPATTYPASSFFADIGSFYWQTWQINNGVLQITNNLTGAVNTVADNIVQLKAQYGITNGTTQSIAQWVNATGPWVTLSAATIPQIRAIRIAVLARSVEKEKPKVRGGPCDATTTAPLPWLGGTPFVLSSDPNWKCYRYQVYNTIIPLKNVLMGGVQ